MATNWNDCNVRCPFFARAEGRRIHCEGIFPGSSNTITFAETKSRKAMMAASCMDDYGACRLYRQVEAKYDG